MRSVRHTKRSRICIVPYCGTRPYVNENLVGGSHSVHAVQSLDAELTTEIQ